MLQRWSPQRLYDCVIESGSRFVLPKLLVLRPYSPQLAPFPTQHQVHNLTASTTVPRTEHTFRLPVPGCHQLEQAQSPRLNHPHTYTYPNSTNPDTPLWMTLLPDPEFPYRRSTWLVRFHTFRFSKHRLSHPSPALPHLLYASPPPLSTLHMHPS